MIVALIPRQLFELTCNQGSKLRPAESYPTKIRFFVSSGCYCQMVSRMFASLFVCIQIFVIGYMEFQK